ncbi:MAG: PAS domain S-box protein [Proteobacteria bacterium]|nr:PAS domain S-box protein [Pseudomonadota bacterium]MBU4036981.1 PAS domain S-box protein [Pseudomonadota bacterium]
MNITEPELTARDEILIVDNAKFNLKLLSDILRNADYKVRTNSDGETALHSAKDKPPPLILLDMKLPGMDGLELCRQLKADKKTCSIPVIFISVLEDESSKIEGFQAGAVDYINKPFYADEVLARVKTHLSIKRLQFDLKSQNAQLLNEITERKMAEKALLESEGKLRTILDATPFQIAVVDLHDDKIHFWSSTALTLFGHTAQTASEWYRIAYPDPDYRREVIDRWKPFLDIARESSETVNTGEYRVTCSNGSERICELYATFLSDILIVTFNDITERKQAEENMEREFQMRTALLDNIPGCIALILKKSTREIVASNRRAREIGAVPGQTCFKTCAMRDDDCPFCLAPKLWTTGNSQKIEVEYRGTWYEGIWEPLSEDLFVHYIFDITERKQAEEELRFQSEIMTNLAEAVYLIRMEDGIIVYTNSIFEKMFGYEQGEMLGKHVSIVNAPSEIKPEETAKNIMAILHEKGCWQGEVKNIRKDGSNFSCYAKVSVFDHSKYGRVLVSAHTDITESKNLQEQLRQSQKLEDVGRLSAGIAHDFNNLLTTIIGNAELAIVGTGKDDPLREMIEEIRGAGKRASELTRQLLAFSRKQILQPEVINLNGIVKDMGNMLCRIIGENIKLRTELASDLGQVEADAGQIEQVIMNLCVNARDAMPMGGNLTIETKNVELDEDYANMHIRVMPGPYVMLAVSDSGFGIAREVQPHIFEPFFTTKDKSKGTGLGLSTVYGIVKQSNGNIWVYSEPGKGTAFKIYLPRCEEASITPKKGEIREEVLHGSETVLLVEDDEMVRNLAL